MSGFGSEAEILRATVMCLTEIPQLSGLLPHRVSSVSRKHLFYEHLMA
jgi:hypothetical protein